MATFRDEMATFAECLVLMVVSTACTMIAMPSTWPALRPGIPLEGGFGKHLGQPRRHLTGLTLPLCPIRSSGGGGSMQLSVYCIPEPLWGETCYRSPKRCTAESYSDEQ